MPLVIMEMQTEMVHFGTTHLSEWQQAGVKCWQEYAETNSS